jgi:hypothetical protein
MSPQTTIQILRCLTLGGYTATVEDGELKIRGPQPLGGPLPASIEARREELIALLNDQYGGTWPPPEPPRKSREERVREYLHSREERVREFLARIRERREGAA